MTEVKKLAQAVQRAEYALKFHEEVNFTDIKEHLKNCREITNSITTFLKFVDKKYCLELVTLCNDAKSDREQINILKQYGTEYKEYYKILSKSIKIGNAISSLIDVKYKQRYIDIAWLNKLSEEVSKRIDNNFPDRDILLEEVKRFLGSI